ncbi:MAG: molybdate ABC transporter ATP-binding protein ModF [Chromatiales bacterium]|nr:molybdate ABC transporter ATP-binding protein ModF [Chromatiales bacterium]
MATITLDKLTVEFDEHFTLHDVSWRIEAQHHWVILGPNGSGKSALAATLVGDGDICNGTMAGVPERVAIVSFEAQAALIDAERKKDDADLLDVISEGTPVREIIDETCADKALQARLIEAFNFDHLLDQSFRKLSSGETRKVLLLRALTSNPDLLILDEPFEGLDGESHTFLESLIAEFAEQVQMILVLNRFDEIPDFVTHVAYTDTGRLEHKIERSDADAMADIHQLLHLKTTDLQVPGADTKPKRPSIGADEPLVRLTDARVAYGDKVIFSDLSWEIHPGKHWQVTGPNGSGKTCLLNLITGDHPQCYVNDILVFGMKRGSGESIWDIKQYIGYVSSALQWEYKVSVSVRNAIISGFYDSIGIYQKYTDVQKDIADGWLALLGLTALADRPFNQLSFGDQRLILIARAMVKHPPLLILDEPCLGLDDLNRQLVLALIEKICAGSETTVLYVNHHAQDTIAGIDGHLAMGDFAPADRRLQFGNH